MHDHVLAGCQPKPLSNYLKALGIIRLISEQKDPNAKGWFSGEAFVIRTSLDIDGLEKFFCDEYSPTPIVSPWNGGSGFYLGDITDGIDAISESNHPRFSSYREVISRIRSWPEVNALNTVDDLIQMLDNALVELGPGKNRSKAEKLLKDIKACVPKGDETLTQKGMKISLTDVENLSKKKGSPHIKEWKAWAKYVKSAKTFCNTFTRGQNKNIILPRCRAELPDSCVQWVDAVCALQSDGKAIFSPVLGTGGNEGRFELSNTFMQRQADLFISGDPAKTISLFKSSIFNTPITGLVKAKIGQYDPGRAGGFNQGMGIEHKDFKINPWDFVLSMEGTPVMASAVVRRNPTEDRQSLTAPFTVRYSPVGFSSSTQQESGRDELWLPIWRSPATYTEIQHLFGEGRSSIGRRMARTGIEFSRAIGTLGVDRGIDSFERYAFLERRGKSYVALPAGRINVFYKPVLENLKELDPISRAVSQFIRGFKNVPATFLSAQHNMEEAVFSCCLKPSPTEFCRIVRCLGKTEKLIAMRDRSKQPSLARPLRGISPKWIELCDDGSVEVRIAAALASIRQTGKVGPIRSYMSPVDPSAPWKWTEGRGNQHWYGSNLPERLSGVLEHRLMDAERTSASSVPLEASLFISPYDVMYFLWGDCDDNKIEELLWGFSVIDWGKGGIREVANRWINPLSETLLSRTWCALKLLYTPGKIRDVSLKIEPRIPSLIKAGRISDACAVAVHRLRVSALNPYPVNYQEKLEPMRLLASLAHTHKG